MSVRDLLARNHVEFETLLHCPASSSSRRAQQLHVSGTHVAKGVLIRSGESHVLAVLPASARIDLEQLSTVLGGAVVTLASEDEVELVFGDCERGALPPFGTLYGVRTIVDSSLADQEKIVCLGNSRHEGLCLRYRDYELIETPLRARFATKTVPSGPAPRHKRAG
jgi:Ala-tRNA(Pro) deacylase